MAMVLNGDRFSEKPKDAEARKVREQEIQELRQTLTAAANGEHLSEDFEAVSAEEGRKFSQDEVNKIVQDRLAKERVKYSEATATMAAKLSECEAALAEEERRLKEERFRDITERELRSRGIFSSRVEPLSEDEETLLDLVTNGVTSGGEILDRINAVARQTFVEQHSKPNEEKPDPLRELWNLH